MSAVLEAEVLGETEGFVVLRQGAALSRLDDRSLLLVRGEDRGSFLQGMLSNEVATLAAGAGTPALLLTEQGRVVADLRVYVRDDEVLLDVPSGRRDDVRAALERFIVADDVEIDDRPEVGLALRGPRSVEVVAKALGADSCVEGEATHASVRLADREALIARVADLGVEGFHFWVAGDDHDAVAEALIAAGARTIAPAVVESQRVVAGVGRWGSEFGLETLAPEVPSLESSISYRKGCYLGQEVVERVAARGHVNWKVALLKSPAALAPGEIVFVGDEEVGRVTSAVLRPDDGSCWALARLRAVLSEPGTAVSVSSEQGRSEAEVVAPAPRDA